MADADVRDPKAPPEEAGVFGYRPVATTSRQVLDRAGADTLTVGGHRDGNGRLLVKNVLDETEVSILADPASIQVGGSNSPGSLVLKNQEGRPVLSGKAVDGTLTLGAQGQAGTLAITNSDGVNTILAEGDKGLLVLGGPDNSGQLSLVTARGRTAAGMAVSAKAGGGSVYDGQAVLWLGAYETAGRAAIHDFRGGEALVLKGTDASILAGCVGTAGRMAVCDAGANETVVIDGAQGDIKLLGADLAELFAAGQGVEPGMVVKLDLGGRLVACAQDHDPGVVGVVSGLGDIRPALVMNAMSDAAGPQVPLALCGRVNCLVDASLGPIIPGDLLVAAPSLGHARRADLSRLGPGMVVGRALQGLASGKGPIQVLVRQGA
jgi:hypothetical protein